MKLIIDTNLWISFLLGKRLAFLQELLSDNRWTIVVCDELIHEITDVATRSKFSRYIQPRTIQNLLDSINDYCAHVKVHHTASSLRDSKDLYLLSLAETVGADYLLSGDEDLLVLKSHGYTQILRFSEFKERFY